MAVLFNPFTGTFSEPNNYIVGATSSADGNLVLFDGTTGKVAKESSTPITTVELKTNKATNFSVSNDTLYPTVKAAKDYADGLVAGLVDFRGSWDASGNLYPNSGGSGVAGAVLKGDAWIISAAGAPGGTSLNIGDLALANIDTPGQTVANWSVISGDFLYVPEDGANKVTSVSSSSTDVQYPSAKLLYDQLLPKITTTSTSTLTNKWVQPRVYSVASNTSLTPEKSTYDIFHITALAGAITINNHSTTTPADGDQMRIRLLDDGTARAITFGNKYLAKGGIALPTTTTVSKNITMGFEWNANLTGWNLLAYRLEA